MIVLHDDATKSSQSNRQLSRIAPLTCSVSFFRCCCFSLLGKIRVENFRVENLWVENGRCHFWGVRFLKHWVERNRTLFIKKKCSSHPSPLRRRLGIHQARRARRRLGRVVRSRFPCGGKTTNIFNNMFRFFLNFVPFPCLGFFDKQNQVTWSGETKQQGQHRSMENETLIF